MRRSLVCIGLIAIFAVGLFLENIPAPNTPLGEMTISVFPPLWSFLAAFVFYGLCWINTVQQWDRRPVMLFGRYMWTVGPGLVFIEPVLFTTLSDVSIQDQVQQLKAPIVQTKDNVGLTLDPVLTFCVNADHVRDAVVEVADVREAVLSRALSILTDVAGTFDLDSLLQHREAFSKKVVDTLQERIGRWGITIRAFELRGFKINDSEIEKAIAMKARAQKEAEAELVRASMQAKIAAALNDASATFTPAGWRLKALEVFLEAVRGQNNTILIPASLAEGLGHMLPRVDLTEAARNGAGTNA